MRKQVPRNVTTLVQTMNLRILFTDGSGVLSTSAGGAFGVAAGGLAGFAGPLGTGGALLAALAD